MNAGLQIVPFLATSNKLYLTTKAFHKVYLKHLQSDSNVGCVATHVSRRVIAGWEVCYVLPGVLD